MYYYYKDSNLLGCRYLLTASGVKDWDPLPKPPPKVFVQRDGRWCGSGPYFKVQQNPYLEGGTYTVNGNRYTFEKNRVYVPQSYQGWGYQFWNFAHDRAVRTGGGWCTYSSCAGGGSYQMESLIIHANGNCYQDILTINWNKKASAFSPAYGCFGIQPSSYSNCKDAAAWVCSYFGVPSSILDSTAQFGTLNYWAAMPEGNSSNVSLKLQRYGPIRAMGDWSFHASWKYDEVEGESRLLEWRKACFGEVPGRIRNAAANALAGAMAGLPETSANSIANILEVSSGISGIIKAGGRGVSGILQKLASSVKNYKDPRNVWLSWRYVYNTTKMDLADYREVTNRLMNITVHPTFKVHGTGSGDGFTVRTVRQYRSADFDILNYDTKRMLRTYGLRLSAYNAWDMVPYSFIVDWFTHIGPKLELCQNWNRQYDFQCLERWYSYYEPLEHGFVYYRWDNVDPLIPPTYVHKQTSKRTMTYRLADTVSIFS